MIQLIKTNSEHPDFINLVKQLDAYLKVTDGNEHDFYNQYNNIDVLNHTVIAYLDDQAIGCGAFKKHDFVSAEIKRMYTKPEYRGQKIAQKILQELEKWANQLGYNNCILETGKRQVEAVKFYKTNNYKVMPNYGQYKNTANSVCFKKELKSNEKG